MVVHLLLKKCSMIEYNHRGMFYNLKIYLLNCCIKSIVLQRKVRRIVEKKKKSSKSLSVFWSRSAVAARWQNPRGLERSTKKDWKRNPDEITISKPKLSSSFILCVKKTKSQNKSSRGVRERERERETVIVSAEERTLLENVVHLKCFHAYSKRERDFAAAFAANVSSRLFTFSRKIETKNDQKMQQFR